MKEKNLKLIMELIFIFILSLAFILPCIHIENNYTYDNYGNYQEKDKSFVFDSPLNYTKILYYKPTIESFEEIYNSGTHTYVYQTLSFNNDNGTYYISQLPITINTSGKRLYNGNYLNWYNVSIVIRYDNDIGDFIFSSNNNNVENTIDYSIYKTGEEFSIRSLSYEMEISAQLFPVPEQVYNKSITINKEVHRTVNTIIGNIKLLFTEYLDFNDSIILDIFLTYTFLWLMMFISWHFLYALFDFVAHLLKIPIKRRE